ncbi:MAG TPA: hypothetical protein DCX07_02010, partial [Phycisphaerales bacterium]|nr:hypothetical protein [Phycisphaerales bacterium]
MSSERASPAATAGRTACTLCPALCAVELARQGPGAWQCEPPENGVGLCPRGSALGELLGHRRRILSAARREQGRLRSISLPSACDAILHAAGERRIIFCLDANVPCEQILAAAAWCGAWRGAALCVALEPAEEQLLFGVEAGGADYLRAEELAECDGFLVIGDAFAANPTCARGVFDGRKNGNGRTPLVVIDAAGGTAGKFATHRPPVPAGREADVLGVVAAAGLGGAPPKG